MIESPDRFYFPHLANIRYALEASGKIGPRLILVQLFAIGIFIVGNFSWRVIGLFNFKRQHLPHLTTVVICSAIPLFFIQNGTAWNTIQFLYYGLFVSNILLVIFIGEHPNKLFESLIIVSSLIAAIPVFQTYLGNPAPSALSVAEIKALKFLSQQPPGTVLSYPYDEFIKKDMSTPIPLYAYETTSYLAAYSSHPTFVDDYMNLANSGFDYQSRLANSRNFFLQKSEFQDRGFLVNNQIGYIYLVGEQTNKTQINTSKMYLTKIYDESEILIYKVQK